MKINRIKVYQAVPFEGKPRSIFNTFAVVDNSEPVVSVEQDEYGVLIWGTKSAVRVGWPNIASIEYDYVSFMDSRKPSAGEKPAKAKKD